MADIRIHRIVHPRNWGCDGTLAALNKVHCLIFCQASIIGRRIGHIRWMSGNPKTVEGTASFILSILLAAVTIRTAGVVEKFSVTRYAASTILAGLLEAFSNQNDNLTTPIYFWSLLVVSDTVAPQMT